MIIHNLYSTTALTEIKPMLRNKHRYLTILPPQTSPFVLFILTVITLKQDLFVCHHCFIVLNNP